MRILLLTTVYPTPVEPTKGVFNLRLAQALARRHDVSVVAPVPWVEAWRGGNVFPPAPRIEASAPEARFPTYWYPPKVLRSLYGWFMWSSVRRQALALARRRRPDVVVGYWAHPDGEAALRLARRLGVPGVVVVGGSDVLLLTRDAARKKRIVNVLRAADAVVTIGDDLREKVLSLGVPRDRVHLGFRGVDRDLFAPGDRVEARRRLGLSPSGSLLLWVGRMVAVKGLDVLLDACVRLRRTGVGFHLALVGDGPLRSELETTARALGLARAVTFAGARAHHDLPDWFRAADATVLPSRSEGVPNVLRESLACGTPFVASRVGGIPDLARGTNSRLVAPGDPDELAAALTGLILHPPAPLEAGARLLGWDDAAEALLRVVRPLVAARRPVPRSEEIEPCPC